MSAAPSSRSLAFFLSAFSHLLAGCSSSASSSSSSSSSPSSSFPLLLFPPFRFHKNPYVYVCDLGIDDAFWSAEFFFAVVFSHQKCPHLWYRRVLADGQSDMWSGRQGEGRGLASGERRWAQRSTPEFGDFSLPLVSIFLRRLANRIELTMTGTKEVGSAGRRGKGGAAKKSTLLSLSLLK